MTMANEILVLITLCCDFCCRKMPTKTRPTSLDSHALLAAKAHIIRLKYTKLATYKFVKFICVLNMSTFIFSQSKHRLLDCCSYKHPSVNDMHYSLARTKNNYTGVSRI